MLPVWKAIGERNTVRNFVPKVNNNNNNNNNASGLFRKYFSRYIIIIAAVHRADGEAAQKHYFATVPQ